MFNNRYLILLVLMLQANWMFAQDLADFKWKKRILLCIDTKNDLQTRNLQVRNFNTRETEMRDRDLILFIYNGREVLDRDGMKTKINPDKIPFGDFQGIVLIGKDGGVKLKKKYLVKANEVFDLIDQMPMRRSEMKNR